MGNSGSSGHNQQGHHRSRHNGPGNGYGHHSPAKWSHSLDTPEQRNRMKSGYFPGGPRGYIHVQRHGMQPPHKVLPTVNVNPGKVLKPTSNGAILHGGGTISGRKLLSELDPLSAEAESLRRAIRKRSTASCPDGPGGDISGISTPNLSSMEYNSPVHGDYFKKKGSGGGSSKGGSSSRDYDSEPDLREVGLVVQDRDLSPDRSVSPLPNTFTLISESPAKKQIRSRKKSKAPLPPPNEQMGKMMNGHHFSEGEREVPGSHGKKRLQRLFKTKADLKSSKQDQQKNSNMAGGVDRGGVMRASIESQRSQRLAMLARESRNRHSEAGRTTSSSSASKSQSIETETTVSNGGAGILSGKTSSTDGSNNKLLKKKNVKATTSAPLCSAMEEQDNNNEAARNLKRGVQVHALPLSREAPSGRHRQVPKKTLTSSRTTTPEPSISTSAVVTNISRRLVQSSDKLNSPSPSDSSNTNGLVDHSNSNNSNNNHNNNNISNNSNRSSSRNSNGPNVPASTKKTFYFGMDMGNFPKAKLIQTSNTNNSNSSELLNNNNITHSSNSKGNDGGRSNNNSSSNNNNSKNVSSSSTTAAMNSAITAAVASSSIKEDEKAKHQEIPNGNNNGKSESKLSRRKVMREVDEFAYKMGQRSAHSQAQQIIQPAAMTNGIVGKKHSVDSSRDLQIQAQQHQQPQRRVSSSGLGHLSHKLNGCNVESSSQALHSQQSPRLANNAILSKGKAAVQQSSHSNSNNTSNVNGHSSSNGNNNHNIHRFLNGKQSELIDSDGLHRRQDSGSFDIEEESRPSPSRVQKKESSSDLSSSDLDIPLLLRPTLPQRRPDLPRFSPTAAWRALDSPRASGRSLSSEEGFHFEDRVQRYTRPMAPPRNSHERSGDSGISAGDGGSPANPLPEIISSNRHINALHTTNSSSSSNNNHHPPHNKIISKLRKQNSHADLGNCWTPEQDLDESSSEFEHEAPIHPIPIPIHTGNLKGSINGSVSSRVGLGVPPGLRTPPKFTTRGHLFDKHGSAVVVSDSDSKYYNGNSAGEDNNSNASKRHLYARSTKAKQVVSNRSNEKIIENKKQIHQSRAKESNAITPSLKRIAMIKSRQNPGKYNNNQFHGLDTNWFLSRSEPNSLNIIPGEEEPQQPPASRRLSSEPFQPEFLHKVFPAQMLSRGSRRSAQNRQRQVRRLSEDLCVDEEHNDFLDMDQDFEEDESDDEDNNRMAREVRSEIGYGPSSMNFYMSPSSPTHPYVNRSGGGGYDGYDHYNNYGDQETNSLNLHCNKTSAGVTSSRRPFSHIMYLPAYDSRRINHYPHHPNQYNRRAKSVDHLDTSELSIFRINGGDDFFESDTEVKQQYRKIVGSSSANNNTASNNSNGHAISSQHHRSRSIEKKSHPMKSSGVTNTNSNKNEKSVSVSRGRSSSPFARSQSVPLYTVTNQLVGGGCDAQVNGDCEEDQLQKVVSSDAQQNPISNNNNKKKFKFQSTLRVLERKIIEKQLAREAEEREMERLREMEAMKKVEEEFQKKRAKEKQEIQNQLRLANMNNNHNNVDNNDNHINNNALTNNNSHANLLKNNKSMAISITSSSSHSQKSSTTAPNSVSTSAMSMSTCATPSSRSSSSIANHNQSSSNQINVNNNKKQSSSNNRQRIVSSRLNKRQEPEGAPAFSTTTDLRKELIQASRKRSGHGNRIVGNGNTNGSGEPLTQELSEYRQENTRQYCDYRRSPRHQSSNSARFAESSSSDIFPISRRLPVDRASNKSSSRCYRSTVHPEVVCDIPGKPFPYMVNFSRLSGSTSNIVSSVIEERPGSGMASGPSSVISDNYRRDWAHHRGSAAGSTHGGGLGPGRASSVASLHSAPGYTPDHLRHSSTDLAGQARAVDSPRIRHKRKSPLFHKYSNSPPASPLPPISAISSNDSNATDPEKDSSLNKGPTSTASISTTTSTTTFQLKPFNKVKGYRPVAFKPQTTTYITKIASTTVN